MTEQDKAEIMKIIDECDTHCARHTDDKQNCSCFFSSNEDHGNKALCKRRMRGDFMGLIIDILSRKLR